jgi:hypothetical protein
LAIVNSLFSFVHTLISGHIAGYSQEVALSAAHLKRTLKICRTRLNQRGMARSSVLNLTRLQTDPFAGLTADLIVMSRIEEERY